jgi:hypothetical protein
MKPIITKRNSILWISKKETMLIHESMPVYESKNGVHSETFFSRFNFYIPCVLVATMHNKVDYWFEKWRIKGPIFYLTYKHNYQKMHTFDDTNVNNK